MRRAVILAAIWLGGCATPRPVVESLPQRSVAECGIAELDRVRNLEVAIAIDTSGSTADPSGADIDGDGTVGVIRQQTPTDRGDSLLSAQVAGVKSLIPALSQRDARVLIVSYSGQDRFDDPETAGFALEAVLHTRLTSDPPAIEDALDQVLAHGSRGTTNFAAAMRRSVDALNYYEEFSQPRRRVVLLISDSATPVMPGPTEYLYTMPEGDPNGPTVYSDPRLKAAAERAIGSGVVIYTFGLGEAADAQPPHLLSRVAGATGGRFHPVKDPLRLHCDLLAALAE